MQHNTSRVQQEGTWRTPNPQLAHARLPRRRRLHDLRHDWAFVAVQAAMQTGVRGASTITVFAKSVCDAVVDICTVGSQAVSRWRNA